MSEQSRRVPPPARPPDDRLDSWKEIAAYLGRDVTTVQRAGAEQIAPAAGAEDSGESFGVHFKDALADLERSTAQADNTAEGLVTGEVDIHEAMVAMEKADLTLRVAGTVRNKVIDAYQQLMQAAGG